jgi:hypothetical protein
VRSFFRRNGHIPNRTLIAIKQFADNPRMSRTPDPSIKLRFIVGSLGVGGRPPAATRNNAPAASVPEV